MCHRPRPLRVGNPKLFLRLPLLRSSSHRHARSLRTSALDYARNFTSESRLSPRTARQESFIKEQRQHFSDIGDGIKGALDQSDRNFNATMNRTAALLQTETGGDKIGRAHV